MVFINLAPHDQAYLNGSKIRKVFNLKTLVTKIIGCVSAVSTAMPVGPEGPMIHIGGMIGGGVSQSYRSVPNDCFFFPSLPAAGMIVFLSAGLLCPAKR